MSAEPAARIVEVRRGILKKNDLLAADLRTRFVAAGVTVVNLVSSPGAGKTTLLERTLTALRERGVRPAALVGDLATDHDANRLAATGAPARQITTGTVCHLAAAADFRRDEAMASLERVRPGIEVIATSARTGEGIDRWVERIVAARSERR